MCALIRKICKFFFHAFCFISNFFYYSLNSDFSSIPEPLATEVARIVDAKFTLDRTHRLKAAHPREDIGANSSLLKEESKARNCHYPLTTVPSNTAILEVEVE